MVGEVLVLFWVSYVLVILGLCMFVVKHPLGVGGLVLLSYVFGRVVAMFNVRFIIGIFLFLTGVSGIMVAFLYVVALCPNPVFRGAGASTSRVGELVGYMVVMLGIPLGIVITGGVLSFGVEVGSLGSGVQWIRDPRMFGGLSGVIPFLGVLLFLCMVRVVSLCGRQKQCLGGHGAVKRAYV